MKCSKIEKNLEKKELEKLYEKIQKNHKEYLQNLGVKLPKFHNTNNQVLKDTLILCILTKYISEPVSKEELTKMVRKFYPNVNDVQQARHLGRQKGWNIASGSRGDHRINLGLNEYCLISLTEAYPGFQGQSSPRSARGGKDFQELKIKFDNRCATCHSKEGEPNFLNKAIITKLEAGHMNPTKPLTLNNMIPQCSECNKAYLDKFIFDGNGRVKDINIKHFRWEKKYKKI